MNVGDEFEGRYRILSELGRGGYATVWLAEHMKIGQKVAIKMTHEPGADPRFLREARVMATLRSPHTVRILDFGETEAGHAYMISEFVDGESLDALRKNGPLPAEEVESILIQVLKSLAEAHQQGIIHRDIKPANLMRTPQGVIKVLDFGIARVSEKVDVGDLTASGIVLGTPRYLAPECLLQPNSVTPSADIFALGLVAFALLTGEDANAGLSSRQIVARTLSNEPFALPEALLVPSALSRWVSIATTKRPDQRFQNAVVALEALQSGGQLEDQTTMETLPPADRQKRTLDGAPHAIARPAAEPTMNEEGALAFGAGLGGGPGSSPSGPQNRHSGGLGGLGSEVSGSGPYRGFHYHREDRDKPEPGLDVDHDVMSEITGERRRAADTRSQQRLEPESYDDYSPQPHIEYGRPRGRGTFWFIVLIFFAIGVAGAYQLGYLPEFGTPRPNLGPTPDDPPHVVETYAKGKAAFKEGRWQEALLHFQNLEQWPDTNSARDLIAKDYIGRIIADVLEDAVDARENARTKKDLEAAADGPRELLEIYPEHEAARYVLKSIEDKGLPSSNRKRTKKRPKKKRPKLPVEREIQIEGIN